METEEQKLAEATARHILETMYKWDGGKPAPGYSHWTPSGIYQIVIAQATMPMVVNVLFNGEWIGSGIHPSATCSKIYAGEYDKDFGFSPRERGLPGNLTEWNNLRA